MSMNAAAKTSLTAALKTIAADKTLSRREKFDARRSAQLDAMQMHNVLEVKAGRCPCCGTALDSWTESRRDLGGRPIGGTDTWVQCVSPKCGQWKSLAA